MQDIVVLSSIKDEVSMKTSLDIALDSMGKGKDFQKTKAHEFLTLIQNQIEKDSDPAANFYSIMMLKEATERGETKLLSVLSSHNLLKYMSRLAKEVDPNKAITEKGKNLYSDKKIGNDFIVVVLECLKVWGEKFKNNKNDQPTKFRKYYTELLEAKVVMPAEFRFFNSSVVGGSYRDSEKRGSDHNAHSRGAVSGGSIQGSEKQSSSSPFQKEFEYTWGKIKTYLDVLETEEEYEQFVHNYHKSFGKESQKYEAILNQVLSSNDPSSTEKVVALNDFFVEEAKAYKQFIAESNDYYSYVQKVKIEAGKLEGLGLDSKEAPQNETAGRSREVNAVKVIRSEARRGTQEGRKNNLMTDNGNKELVSELMSKLNEKERPNSGFRGIHESLSKDKAVGKSKRSTSRLKKSSVSKFAHSRSKSRIADIFANPPNSYPKDRRYEGDLIEKNYDLSNVLRSLSKSQGIRRFISCNFKAKSPLFENTQIQIGVKSEPIYEEVSEFKTMISIELYIGNKTEETLRNFSIEYKGNQDVLLYGNPRKVEETLEGGYQNKHELLVVPLNFEFPLIRMLLQYSVGREQIREEITMPNSAVKLAHYMGLSKRDFVQHWNNADIFRTEEFKLTRYIAPDALSKYILRLEELSSYNEFAAKGSESDFELGCMVVLKQQSEGVLKISVRPNLKCVIQIAVLDRDEESHENFIFYMQTLQMLMTHAEHHS